MPTKRIVYTVAVGRPIFAKMALGMGRSLRLLGDTATRVVLTDLPEFPWNPAFDQVVPWDPSLGSVYLAKLTALQTTDADEVLFIDADSLVFKRLDPIFEYCRGNDLCVNGHPVTEGEWYGDVAEHCRHHQIPSMPKFNGGMIYYERTERAKELIATTFELHARVSELGFDDVRVVEEPTLALAMAKTGIGNLCPMELDFMSAGTGLVGRLTLDVCQSKCSFVARGQTTRLIRPYIFHAWRYKDFLRYPLQLRRLERLEEYEKRYGPGHIPESQRLRRSIEKRLIKLFRLM